MYTPVSTLGRAPLDPWMASSSSYFYSPQDWSLGYSSQSTQLQLESLVPQSPPTSPASQIDGSTTSFIGVPVYFSEGRFAGETIYTELQEIQKPEYGRRFGSVDRRVLDDPPVVALRVYQVHDDGGAEGPTMKEVEDYDTVAIAGLICTVDLFDVEPTTPTQTTVSEPALAYVEGYAITEAAKRTSSLFGTTFVEVHAVTLPGELLGPPRDDTVQSPTPAPAPTSIPGSTKKMLLFTFSVSSFPRGGSESAAAKTRLEDLAVRLEGRFCLRYRFFDVLSRPAGHPHPAVLAEHYGGAFTVYSTKMAPALKESTELTKILGKHHVPVNIRKKQRAPRRKVKSASPSLSLDLDSDVYEGE